MKRLIALLTLFLTACGTTTYTVQLNPVPAQIEFVEHRTFWSTTSVAIVHDGQHVLGVTSGTGKPIADFAGDVISAAAIGAGMVYIGGQLPKINTGTSNVNVVTPTLPSFP